MNIFKPYFLNIKGKLTEISSPWVMGILNSTPDSFYDGGMHLDINNALHQCEKMLKEGARIIDIGGQSSKPGANWVSEDEEIKRTLPLIEAVFKNFPEAIISIDTFQSKVANEALSVGACIVNDISAGDDDPNMLEVVKRHQAVFVAMHKQGNSKTMQINPRYQHVSSEVYQYLYNKKNGLFENGIKDIIVDVGFGFGKNMEHNFQLLHQLSFFQELNLPILVGLSRKSMVYKTLGTEAMHALNGTSVLNTVALMNGAHILRVHDVKEAYEAIKLMNELRNYNSL
jgi:dihydropteroate synthase